jgi:hypothetical protein
VARVQGRETPLLLGIVGLQLVLVGMLAGAALAVMAGIGLALCSSAWTARDRWIACSMAPLAVLDIVYDLGFVPISCEPNGRGGSTCFTPTPPDAVEAYLTYLAYAGIVYLAWRLLRSRDDDPLAGGAVVAGGEGRLEVVEPDRPGREPAPVEGA